MINHLHKFIHIFINQSIITKLTFSHKTTLSSIFLYIFFADKLILINKPFIINRTFHFFLFDIQSIILQLFS